MTLVVAPFWQLQVLPEFETDGPAVCAANRPAANIVKVGLTGFSLMFNP